MKIKSLAMLAVSGLMAASIAYATPGMADESNNDLPMMGPTLADNGTSPMTAPADNGAQSDINGSASPSSDNAANNGSANQGQSDTNASSNDQGSPDTATGDDDY